MKNFVLLLLLSFLTLSCSSLFSSFRWSSIPSNQTVDYYFPYESWQKEIDGKIDSSSMNSYAETLRKFGAESLYKRDTNLEAFRFIISESFRGLYVLQLENGGNLAYLRWKKLVYGFPGTLDEITENKEVKLNISDWMNMKKALENSGFWTTKKEKYYSYPECGGGVSLLEAWVDGKYQVSERYFIPDFSEVNIEIKSLIEETDINDENN